MREKTLFVILTVLLLSLLSFYFFKSQITGFFASVAKIFLSVSPSTRACVYLTVSNETALEGSTVYITLITENCGSQNFSGYSEITLLDALNRTIFSSSSLPYSLTLGSTISFKTSWYASPPGKYLVIGKVFYDNKTEIKYKTITVKTPPAPLPPPPPTAAPIPPVVAVPAILNMSIEYPRILNVTQAVAYPILFVVNNTGTLPIRNLTLKAWSSEKLIMVGEIRPEVVPELRPGTSAIFLFAVFVHPETHPGNYNLYFNVSDEISRSGRITLVVKKLEIKERAFSLLRYYEFLIDSLESLAMKVKKVERRNVTLALNKLMEAKREFKVCENLYEMMFYEKSIEKLEDVKEKLSEVVELLTVAPPIEVVKPAKPTKPLPYHLFLLPLVVIVVIAATMAFWRRRKPVLRYKRW